MYYTYILYSEKINKFYIGSSGDLKERVKQHNHGDSEYTKSGLPWSLVYYEAFTEKKDATTEEKFLKSGKGRERRKYLLKTYLKNLFKRNGEVARVVEGV